MEGKLGGCSSSEGHHLLVRGEKEGAECSKSTVKTTHNRQTFYGFFAKYGWGNHGLRSLNYLFCNKLAGDFVARSWDRCSG